MTTRSNSQFPTQFTYLFKQNKFKCDLLILAFSSILLQNGNNIVVTFKKENVIIVVHLQYRSLLSLYAKKLDIRWMRTRKSYLEVSFYHVFFSIFIQNDSPQASISFLEEYVYYKANHDSTYGGQFFFFHFHIWIS